MWPVDHQRFGEEAVLMSAIFMFSWYRGRGQRQLRRDRLGLRSMVKTHGMLQAAT